ncbi:mycofactocin biosynthesis chaperone MftB [Leifsonia sp. NPDC080035]|uniref:Mycofactocin biosynthesis chaperone MftB n=1 Tax=Leifsonia sp. NPDC080035 TaxID=3143936 RepID=A0AAU7G9I5_9MICO
MSTDITARPADTGEPISGRIDLERAWRVHPQVSIRPEPFGALLYHFGTRTLSFLKDPRLLAAVNGLSAHATAREACLAAGIEESQLPRFAVALETLRRSQMIVGVPA